MQQSLVTPSPEIPIWEDHRNADAFRILYNKHTDTVIIEVEKTVVLPYHESTNIEKHTRTERIEIKGGNFRSLHMVWGYITGEVITFEAFKGRIEQAIEVIGR